MLSEHLKIEKSGPDCDKEYWEFIDSLIEYMKKTCKPPESRVSLVNPLRVRELRFTYDLLKETVTGADIEITLKKHSPITSMGVIAVSGKEIIFKDTKEFKKATSLATNFEVYSKTNGTVEMNFTFHGLTLTKEYFKEEK